MQTCSRVLHELISTALACGHIHQQLAQPLGGSYAQRRLSLLVLSLQSQQKHVTVLSWTPMLYNVFCAVHVRMLSESESSLVKNSGRLLQQQAGILMAAMLSSRSMLVSLHPAPLV